MALLFVVVLSLSGLLGAAQAYAAVHAAAPGAAIACCQASAAADLQEDAVAASAQPAPTAQAESDADWPVPPAFSSVLPPPAYTLAQPYRHTTAFAPPPYLAGPQRPPCSSDIIA